MSKATQIKILFLLFAYSAVLFHSAIPHCHTNDGHSAKHGQHASHHSCNNPEHQEEDSAPHEHQVCHNENLHSDYIKSESIYKAAVDFSDDFFVALFNIVFLSNEDSHILKQPEVAALVRSCCSPSHALRGPPNAIVG